MKTLKDIADYDCADCGYDVSELRLAAKEWIDKEDYFLKKYEVMEFYRSIPESKCIHDDWIKTVDGQLIKKIITTVDYDGFEQDELDWKKIFKHFFNLEDK